MAGRDRRRAVVQSDQRCFAAGENAVRLSGISDATKRHEWHVNVLLGNRNDDRTPIQTRFSQRELANHVTPLPAHPKPRPVNAVSAAVCFGSKSAQAAEALRGNVALIVTTVPVPHVDMREGGCPTHCGQSADDAGVCGADTPQLRSSPGRYAGYFAASIATGPPQRVDTSYPC
jgi:hypothetical protein